MDNGCAGISTGSSASTKSKSIEDMVRLNHENLYSVQIGKRHVRWVNNYIVRSYRDVFAMKLDKCYDILTFDVIDLCKE